MPLHPQAQVLAAEPAPSPRAMGIGEYRAAARALIPLSGEPEPIARVVERDALRSYAPAGAHGTLVFLHGGGWVRGDLDTHDPLCRALARRAGCRVLSVDYRLAPEFPFPAALEDARGALARASRVFAGPLALGGDSSGGGLAAALALEGGVELALLLLLCPALDLTLTSPSVHRYGEGYVLTAEALRWCRDAYLRGTDPTDPRASPLRARDLSGVPPTWVLTAEYDPLHDDGERWAARLRDAGRPVEHVDWPGQLHGFPLLLGTVDDAPRAVDRAAAAVRRAFGTAGGPVGS